MSPDGREEPFVPPRLRTPSCHGYHRQHTRYCRLFVHVMKKTIESLLVLSWHTPTHTHIHTVIHGLSIKSVMAWRHTINNPMMKEKSISMHGDNEAAHMLLLAVLSAKRSVQCSHWALCACVCAYVCVCVCVINTVTLSTVHMDTNTPAVLTVLCVSACLIHYSLTANTIWDYLYPF